MQNDHPTEEELSWQAEQEAGFQRRRRQAARNRFLLLFLAALLLALTAIVPLLMGVGIFGLSSFKATEKALWVYNTTDTEASVDIAYEAPLAIHYTETLAPYAITHTRLKTGHRVIRTTVHGAETSHRVTLTHPTIVTLGSETCLAVFDMTPFYHRSQFEDPSLKLVDTIEAGTAVYQVQADGMVVPRQAMPRNVNGTIHWVEDFGCDLLKEENRDVLMMRARQKLEEREDALQKQMEERQR